jgi:hypothetical protein
MPPKATAPRAKLTPPQVAARYGVSPEKVLTWIHAGDLRAVNVATRATGRPRWLVDEADLIAFEQRRQANVAGPARPARRRARQMDVIEFY